MQIEAEKRALLRWILLGVSALLAVSLLLTGWMFRRYSMADSLIRTANEKATTLESQLQQVSRELAEKKAILEKSSSALSKQNAVISSTVPKMLNKAASPNELAELAQAVYQQPGHMIDLPGIPPDSVLRSYRTRVDGRTQRYILVAGLLDGNWVLYSLLVRNQGE